MGRADIFPFSLTLIKFSLDSADRRTRAANAVLRCRITLEREESRGGVFPQKQRRTLSLLL